VITVLAPPAVADPPAAVPAILELMADMHPRLALAMANALGEADPTTLRATAHHLLGALASDSRIDQDVDAVVTRAHRAQAAFENWTDPRIDALLSEAADALAGRSTYVTSCRRSACPRSSCTAPATARCCPRKAATSRA
jgi:HPt (histidine-containing phosphotransfer) domain-containing protein